MTIIIIIVVIVALIILNGINTIFRACIVSFAFVVDISGSSTREFLKDEGSWIFIIIVFFISFDRIGICENFDVLGSSEKKALLLLLLLESG